MFKQFSKFSFHQPFKVSGCNFLKFQHFFPVAGFTGFSSAHFNQNLKPIFKDHVSFFTVLGVFFPAACGVMSGINMSGELKDPNKSIPVGSLAALAVR